MDPNKNDFKELPILWTKMKMTSKNSQRKNSKDDCNFLQTTQRRQKQRDK